VWVTFPPSTRTVQLKVGLSFSDQRNAFLNLAAENPAWSFPEVRQRAREKWNEVLNTIQVSGGSPGQEQSFYTALYHAMLHPNAFSDVNGQYSGFDGRIHVVRGRNQDANFSGWDIYRTQIPLLAWLQPRLVSDMMQSLLEDGRQLGALPKWPLANAESGVMNGDSADPIFASAWAFGARQFDAKAALSLMEDGATPEMRGAGGYIERPGLGRYPSLGYVPFPSGIYGSAAMTLEYGVDDFSIARFAEDLGDHRAADAFMQRAQAWQHLFNPATGFIEPSSANGAFVAPFDPSSESGFVEGNSWIYSWWVPHNLRALFRAMGGDGIVIKRLNQLFLRFADGPDTRNAWLGNEPSLDLPWAYDFTREPWRLQALLRRIVATLYPRAAYGLPGNDDLGTMSAWLVWTDLGLYPAIPGLGGVVLSAPVFPRTVVHLPSGGVLRIVAPGASPTIQYIRGVSLGGLTYHRTFASIHSLDVGGELRFTLGRTPSTNWGAGKNDAPPSFSQGEAPAIGFTDPSKVTISPGRWASFHVGAQNVSNATLHVRCWIVGMPRIISSPPNAQWRIAMAGDAVSSVTLKASPSILPGRYLLDVRFQTAKVTSRGESSWTSLPHRRVQLIVN
jgi:predicted alpha-1,2-mannosidase